jgi:hypothetical protein
MPFMGFGVVSPDIRADTLSSHLAAGLLLAPPRFHFFG